MLEFQHPQYLWYLLALPALAGVLLLSNIRRARLLNRFIDHHLLKQLVPHSSNAKRVLRQMVILLALGLLIITLANPQVGTRLEEVKREGIDLFVALDVSLSMKCEDVRPNRLEKAKRDVSILLKKLSGDRVGLIVFAGDAFVQFPLTADYSAADLFLSAVDVESVPTPGTMIASAIDKALGSFSNDLPTQKAIIVVSDGENTEGDVAGAVERAQKAGVKIFAIGMGTLEGGPIPVYDSRGNRVDYKRDRASNIVLTRLDESALQKIASVSGGSYRRATSGGNEINDVYNDLTTLEKTEFGVKQITGYESQFQYPLGLGILLLLLEFLLTERRGRLLSRFRGLVAAVILILLCLFLSPRASAQTVRSHIASGNEFYADKKYGDAEASYKKAQEKDPASREAQFNLGDTYYRQERYEESLRAFSTAGPAAKDPVEQSAALHNIGNSLLKSGKIQESIEAYKRALKLNPTDDETRYNYQYARELLKQQQQKDQQKNQDKNKDQKQDQQQKDQQQDRQKDQQQNENQQNQQQQQEQERKAREEQAKAAQQKNQLPKEQAEQILEALRNNEKEIQKQLRKREGAKIRVEKDW